LINLELKAAKLCFSIDPDDIVAKLIFTAAVLHGCTTIHPITPPSPADPNVCNGDKGFGWLIVVSPILQLLF
jgi:hypothetical protein